MSKCIKINKRKRQLCIGDMRDRITLQNRAITPPVFGSPDFTENFSGDLVIWSLVETATGEVIFDDINQDRVITHKIYIRFDSTITAETWIILNGSRLDILAVENLDGRNSFMLLTCTDRGSVNKQAAQA